MAAAPAFLAKAYATEGVANDAEQLNKNLFDVIDALQKVKGHRALDFRELHAASHVDVEASELLIERLATNMKVTVRGEGSGRTFQYKAKFKLASKAEVLALVDHTPEGRPLEDFKDSYGEVKSDVDKLVESAEVTGIYNANGTGLVLFPRQDRLLCGLSGTVSVEKGSRFVVTSVDLRGEVRRRDCIVIDGKVCRVSSSTTDSKEDDPVFTIVKSSKDSGAGASASSTVPHKLRGQEQAGERQTYRSRSQAYRFEFTESKLPLAVAWEGETVKDVPAFKYGLTNDVRDLWSSMSKQSSWPGNVAALREKLGVGKQKFVAKVGATRRRNKRPRANRRGLSNQMDYLQNTKLGKRLRDRHQKG